MDKGILLGKVLDMIAQQHDKMDGATLPADIKLRYEGFIEALYQIESLIVNWSDD